MTALRLAVSVIGLLVTLAEINGERPPNIVIMIADDLGIGDVGCFGNDTIQTPHIDSIAKQGVKLTQHLTAAAVCTPSRAAFLTGRYPIRMGMVPHWILRVHVFLANQGGLPPEEITLPEVLRDEGYTNALIGKWHLGVSCKERDDFCHHPLKNGFDYYYGVPLTNLKDFSTHSEHTVIQGRNKNIYNIYWGSLLATICALLFSRKNLRLPRSIFWFLLIFTLLFAWYFKSTFFNMKNLNSLIMRNFEVVEQPITFNNLTQHLVSEGVEFLTNRSEDNKPFFLMMSWVQVHTVLYNSVPGFRGRSKHGEYGDNVEEMDWSVGQILKALEVLGFKNNTFVYFSSDNGGHLEELNADGTPGGGYNGIYRGGKAQGGMDGGIRVPSVAMWPGKIKPETVIDTPTSQMDIFPTISNIVGGEIPSDREIDGQDIQSILTSEKDIKTDERFLVHYCGHIIHSARYLSRDGRVWKAHFITPKWIPGTETCTLMICDCYGAGRVVYHDPPLLYEIMSDPGERNALDTNTKEHKDVLKIINDEVSKHKASVKPVTNQFALHRMLALPWLQPCCDGCSCTDKKFSDTQSP